MLASQIEIDLFRLAIVWNDVEEMGRKKLMGSMVFLLIGFQAIAEGLADAYVTKGRFQHLGGICKPSRLFVSGRLSLFYFLFLPQTPVLLFLRPLKIEIVRRKPWHFGSCVPTKQPSVFFSLDFIAALASFGAFVNHGLVKSSRLCLPWPFQRL